MTQLSLFDADLLDAVVVHPVAPSSEAPSPEAPSPETPSPQTLSLLQLAELIRQGREQMAAERGRGESIQQIGDLARSVLLRHDLVARRRTAAEKSDQRIWKGQRILAGQRVRKPAGQAIQVAS